MSQTPRPFFTKSTYEAIRAEFKAILSTQKSGPTDALDQLCDAVEFLKIEVQVSMGEMTLEKLLDESGEKVANRLIRSL